MGEEMGEVVVLNSLIYISVNFLSLKKLIIQENYVFYLFSSYNDYDFSSLCI
jgi:hypothetical protein